MRPPTADEIRNESIVNFDGLDYKAFWFPQLGGYCGKAWLDVRDENNNDCFDVYLYHDGAFPFDDKDPVNLHFCDVDQIKDFYKFVQKEFKRVRGIK